MRIAFDARWIYEEPSGIGVYAREMISRLPVLMPDDEFVLIFGSDSVMKRELAFIGSPPRGNVKAVVFPYGPLSLKSQLAMPHFLLKIKPDLYHSPNYMAPFAACVFPFRAVKRCVINIHDVIPIAVPGYAPNSRTSRLRGIYRMCLRAGVACADAVITGSKASKRDIRRLLHLSEADSKKIKVIYDGAGNRAVQRRNPPPVEPDGVPAGTILYVGRIDPYKNVVGLVRAVYLAGGRLSFPLKLIVAGAEDPRYPEARELASELGVDAEFTGFVTDERLADLYASSDMLAHPSLYEGFGLQIIEAMRSGLPVCCTDGGSQPEICGDAGVVVPAGDVDAMTGAIVEILGNPEKRKRMRAAGFERAALFTWDKTAADTAGLLRSFAAAPELPADRRG